MDSVSPDDGRVLTVQSENFRLSELLSERDFEETRERIVVYEGQKLDDGATVILKLRYQRRPMLKDEKENAAIIIMGKREFTDESHAIQKCQTSERTPVYYRHAELVQSDISEIYPGGYLNVLIMSKVPGRSIINLLLDEQEITIVNQQLAEILEHMRLQGFIIDEPATKDVFFDRTNNQTYFIGMSGLVEGNPEETEPITASSFVVRSFGVASRAIRPRHRLD